MTDASKKRSMMEKIMERAKWCRICTTETGSTWEEPVPLRLDIEANKSDGSVEFSSYQKGG